MLTTKQIKIFGAFLMQPYKEKTYQEIKLYSKENSNSTTQTAISKFLSEEIITKKKIGNILLYKLNLKNQKTFSYFQLLIEQQLPKEIKLSLKTIIEETLEVIFKSIVIFGSYAINKQNNKSDLDIVILIKDATDKRKIELSVKSAELKCLVNIDAHIFTKDEMIEMLKDKNENLGKQIAKKHLALQNPEIFYSIIEEAIKNGFDIIY